MRRLWAPRLQGLGFWSRARRRMRVSRRAAEEFDVVDPGCAGDLLDDAIVVVAVIAAIGFLVFIGIPLVLAVVDLMIALALTALGLAGRVLFRRPWIVEARGPDGSSHRYRVVGWRASREQVETVANALAHGNPLPEATAGFSA